MTIRSSPKSVDCVMSMPGGLVMILMRFAVTCAQQERGERRVVRRQPKRPSAQPAFTLPQVTEQTDARERD